MIKAIETRYGDCQFRSRAEARWAVFFNKLGLKWEYEKEGFELQSGRYLPDFWLPEIAMWLEVKGEKPSDREVAVARNLAKETGKDVLLAVGPPRPAEQIMWFSATPVTIGPTRDGTDLYYFADDRRNLGEFWLISDGGEASSIGPIFGPRHDRYPLVHALTAKAYAAAGEARFEHGEKPK